MFKDRQRIRLPRLKPFVPKPGDPAIFSFNSERDEIVDEVVRRVLEPFHEFDRPRERLEHILNDTAFQEIRRLESQRDREASESLSEWRTLVRRIAKMSDAEKRQALGSIAESMARDIAGNFDPRVYRVATRLVPSLLTGIMDPSALPKAVTQPARPPVDELLSVEGPIEELRSLAQKGTLVFVPTHSSNMDSLAFGYALLRSGLPPVIYGAGKNLFTNPLTSFFMHNLGAYRIDRRIRAQLYKDILKAYSTVMIERGYHSLFFPGGTRSRSGAPEERLKLGLAGTALDAFVNNHVRGLDRPVWFVPATINYALTLEAESLIEDWLREEGKARYIVDNDEFGQVQKWIRFFRKVVGITGACVIRFSMPLDPFGNPVSAEGHSLSPSGHRIDPATYVWTNGAPSECASRDRAYMQDLEQALVKRYTQETVVMATQLVAHVLFKKLIEATPGLDLFQRLRFRGEVAIPRAVALEEIDRCRGLLCARQEQGLVRATELLHRGTADEILQRALHLWNGYHERVAARYVGEELLIEDPVLLLYYRNRLRPLEDELAAAPDAPAPQSSAQRLSGAQP